MYITQIKLIRKKQINKSVRFISTWAIDRRSGSFNSKTRGVPYIIGTRSLSTFLKHNKEDDNLVSSELSENPWFWTGLIDAEGSFTLSLTKDSKYSTGWRVKLVFSLGSNRRDKAILEKLHAYFGVGNIYEQTTDLVRYHVTSLKDLAVIITHLDKFPLISKKKKLTLNYLKKVSR